MMCSKEILIQKMFPKDKFMFRLAIFKLKISKEVRQIFSIDMFIPEVTLQNLVILKSIPIILKM